MQGNRSEDNNGLLERNTCNAVQEDLRKEDQDALTNHGDGLLPNLTKAYRATKIHHYPVSLS